MSAQVHVFPDRFDRDGERWEPWITEEAIAHHFSVSTATIRRWRGRGMPSSVFGGSRRYRITSCEKWHRSVAS